METIKKFFDFIPGNLYVTKGEGKTIFANIFTTFDPNTSKSLTKNEPFLVLKPLENAPYLNEFLFAPTHKIIKVVQRDKIGYVPIWGDETYEPWKP